eukprot:scaffold109845_cov44-Phaeocystis_antarctica.AAC.2
MHIPCMCTYHAHAVQELAKMEAPSPSLPASDGAAPSAMMLEMVRNLSLSLTPTLTLTLTLTPTPTLTPTQP